MEAKELQEFNGTPPDSLYQFIIERVSYRKQRNLYKTEKERVLYSRLSFYVIVKVNILNCRHLMVGFKAQF